jgi:hypothetical protein
LLAGEYGTGFFWPKERHGRMVSCILYTFVFRNLILATVFATGTSLAWYFLVNKRRKDNYAAFYQVSASCASKNQSKFTKEYETVES